MELTSQNVHDTIKACLFDKAPADGPVPENAVLVHGVVLSFGFDPELLQKQKENIESMLQQLPETFLQTKGGGWSFLEAPRRRDGVQWGEHRDVDELVCLGLAINKVKYCLPREVWSALPGGVPYFLIVED